MNLPDRAAVSALLDAHGELTVLLEQATYTAAAKTRIVDLLSTLGLARSDTAEFFVLRRIRGRLLRRPQAGGVEVVADGRADWIGWVEPTTDRIRVPTNRVVVGPGSAPLQPPPPGSCRTSTAPSLPGSIGRGLGQRRTRRARRHGSDRRPHQRGRQVLPAVPGGSPRPPSAPLVAPTSPTRVRGYSGVQPRSGSFVLRGWLAAARPAWPTRRPARRAA